MLPRSSIHLEINAVPAPTIKTTPDHPFGRFQPVFIMTTNRPGRWGQISSPFRARITAKTVSLFWSNQVDSSTARQRPGVRLLRTALFRERQINLMPW